MKLWKKLIRIWFTMASLASFLVGWVVLAHAPKPNQFNASNVPTMPRLDPVPSLDQMMISQQSQSQAFGFSQRRQQAQILRSGGS
jgi:hypothetical protein